MSPRRAEKRPDLHTPLKARVERLPCLLAGRHVCTGDVIAHHVVHKNHAGDRLPDGTGNLVPACFMAHLEIHAGKRTFERRWGIDLAAEAARLGEGFVEMEE